MRTALLLLLPLVGGCPFVIDDVFIDDVAFETGGPSSCGSQGAPGWPERDTAGVPLDVVPEVHIDGTLPQMAGMSGVLMTEQGFVVGVRPELTASSQGVLIAFTPESRLTPLTDYTLVVRAPNLVDEVGCSAQVRFGFRTGVEVPQPSAPPLGSWWLTGDDRANAAAAIFGRLFPRMGEGYGLAPQINITAGPAVSLGTIRRSFGLPPNPADAPDALSARWDDDGLHVVDGTWVIDDAQGEVRVTGLQLDARVAEDGASLGDVHLRGVFDLRAWSPEAIAEACALGDTYGRPCLPCDDGGEVACLALDARGMSAAAWIPPAAR